MSSGIWNDFSYVICSCDQYEDTWVPHLVLLKRFWPELESRIYLCSETKKCIDESVTMINDPSSSTWSERIYNSLDSIQTEIILLTLDDYFLLQTVASAEILKCVQFMKDNSNVSFISLHPSEGDDKGTLEGWSKKGNRDDWKISLQAGLWRKNDLKSLLKLHENPWQFEVYGKERAKHSKKEFYYRNSKYGTVFFYNPSKYGLLKGYWTRETPALLAKYGIVVDYDKMGFATTEDQYLEGYKTGKLYSIRDNFPKGMASKRFWVEAFNRIILYIKSVVIH